MKKTAKVLAVVLAVIMALSVLPVVSLAAKTDDSDARVAGWKTYYTLYLDTIFDNSKFASWSYVDQNTKALTTTMNVYTAFALYDSAWRNYATDNVSIEDAKAILLAMIEKAEYDFDDGYVDEIVKVLETAQDVNDFIQKVNKYANIDLFKSAGWSTTFKVIGDVTKIANAYQNYRDKFIAAYANVLSVQMANAYYVDMLQYIVDNAKYDVLVKAAAQLIEDINKSVEDVIGEIVAGAAGDAAEIGVDYLLNLAMNSNAYTAVAMKVYDGAKSVADFLWNTGDMYKHIDTIVIAYYFQSSVANWAKEALNGDDADKALIAVDMLLTARQVSENSLYNYKLAENDGVVGKIKSALYGNIFEDIEISLASINAIRSQMFDKDVAAFRKVVRAIYAYCPVDVQVAKNSAVAYTLKDGTVLTSDNDAGLFVSVYSEYDKDYLKIAYLYDTYTVTLTGTDAGKVTLIMDVLNNDGKLEDWSFTDRDIQKNGTISFNTNFEGTPYFTASDANGAIAFNDNFVAPKQEQASASDVANAVVTVGKNEAKSFGQRIKEFFENLFKSILNAFKIKK